MMTAIKATGIAFCILLSGCGYFPESEFTLSSDARLPRWFQQPSGVAREDLSISASYYVGHYVVFVLRNDRTGRQLGKVRAEILNKTSLRLPNSRRQDGITPNYDVVRADGIVDILEFSRIEPVFEMVDDPDVRSKLLAMTGNDAPPK